MRRPGPRLTKALFRGVVAVGMIGRPVWRSRIGASFDRRARSYFRTRGDVVTRDSLRSQR